VIFGTRERVRVLGAGLRRERPEAPLIHVDGNHSPCVARLTAEG
jgi:hypothetical protein